MVINFNLISNYLILLNYTDFLILFIGVKTFAILVKVFRLSFEYNLFFFFDQNLLISSFLRRKQEASDQDFHLVLQSCTFFQLHKFLNYELMKMLTRIIPLPLSRVGMFLSISSLSLQLSFQ